MNGAVSCRRPGGLFLCISDYPNWRIYIDGERAERVDGLNIAFTGAMVPAGDHSIKLVYVNRNLRAGSVLTVIGVLFLAAALIYRKRHKPQDQNR